MRADRSGLLLSASDLMGHLNCGHLTELDKAVAFGTRDAPTIWNRLLEVLRARGEEHEEAYRKHLAGLGLRMTTIGGKGVDDRSLSETRTAVKEGFDVIAQAALSHDRWVGRADFLLKADRASNLGAHSYEVIDTKLARHTKGGTILQLCLYTELLGHLQGIVPERMYVVSPSAEFECQWRSKKGPPRRCKKGPLGGCGLVPVVHGRAPRATRRALNRLTRRRAREGPVGPRGQAWAGWSVQLAVGV